MIKSIKLSLIFLILNPVLSISSDYSEPSKYFFPLGTFLVNLNEPQLRTYLKVTINIGYIKDSVRNRLELRLAELKHSVIMLLSSKTLKEVRNSDGKRILRRELTHTINTVLRGKEVNNVYFMEFSVH